MLEFLRSALLCNSEKVQVNIREVGVWSLEVQHRSQSSNFKSGMRVHEKKRALTGEVHAPGALYMLHISDR